MSKRTSGKKKYNRIKIANDPRRCAANTALYSSPEMLQSPALF